MQLDPTIQTVLLNLKANAIGPNGDNSSRKKKERETTYGLEPSIIQFRQERTNYPP